MRNIKTLTIFTPTYNRKHTISRTYNSICSQTSRDFDWLIIDDGSTDGTREWVESLGLKISTIGESFDWMGRPLHFNNSSHFVVLSNESVPSKQIRIEYIYKPNGGLYTGYNVAYAVIRTMLCVCIDSDDYMPNNAVENIVKKWMDLNYNGDIETNNLAGIVGLDFNVVDKKPIGGFFQNNDMLCYWEDLHHSGDSKHVMRTDLMRSVSPQVGFEGEKDFNPYYMLMQICDKYPVIVVNDNYCWVVYQTTGDSMSAGIWKQYIRSPRSYAKYRLMQLQMKHGINLKRTIELCIHYVSACVLSNDGSWLKNASYKLLTLCVSPLGYLLSLVVRFKNRNLIK